MPSLMARALSSAPQSVNLRVSVAKTLAIARCSSRSAGSWIAATLLALSHGDALRA